VSIPTGGPPAVVTESVIMRLYDEIREMRNEVTGMRSDIRDLTTTMHTAMTQVGDHEMRIREVERTVEPMKDHEQRIASMEKKVWAAAGVVSLISAGSAVAGTLLAMGR
jgi:predicted  nucleic acid-binding Zn-ribbon protein